MELKREVLVRESLSNAESSSTGLLLKVRRDALRTRASIKPELKKRAVIKQLKHRVTCEHELMKSIRSEVLFRERVL